MAYMINPPGFRVIDITDPQARLNLSALRDFLMHHDLKFDMSHFRTPDDEDNIDGIDVLAAQELTLDPKACTSAGDPMGWAPFVIRPDDDCYDDGGNVDFSRFMGRHFGINEAGVYPFLWIFSELWSNIDNSQIGAAFRIDAYLSGEMADEDVIDGILFDEQADDIEIYARMRNAWLDKHNLET